MGQITNISARPDGTTLTKVGSLLSVKDDGITEDKINVVGLDGTTGKVNDINSTNFKSLDGSNLTGIGLTDFASGLTATASGSASTTGDLDKATDGNDATFAHIRASGTPATMYLTWDMGEEKIIQYLEVMISVINETHTLKFQLSSDNANFTDITDLVNYNSTDNKLVSVVSDKTSARYVRLLFTDSDGGTEQLNIYKVRALGVSS